MYASSLRLFAGVSHRPVLVVSWLLIGLGFGWCVLTWTGYVRFGVVEMLMVSWPFLLSAFPAGMAFAKLEKSQWVCFLPVVAAVWCNVIWLMRWPGSLLESWLT